MNDSIVKEQGRRPGHCMVSACICCYDAYDFQDFLCCCAGTCDCLCIRSSSCMALGYDSLGCGTVTNEYRNEICKVGCILCDCGIILPSTCCSWALQVLWYQMVGSLPFNQDYVNDCVCGCCLIQCAPFCGICMAPPVAPAFTKLKNTQTLRPGAFELMERE